MEGVTVPLTVSKGPESDPTRSIPADKAASVVPYRAFKTKDGDILIGGANDRLFGVLSKCLGRPEWASDERFSTNPSRVENRDLLEKSIEDITMSRSTSEWLTEFESTGLPYAKVNDLKDTVEHPHGTVLHSQKVRND